MKKLLNSKQKSFCREYALYYNGTQAAIKAGYSKKTAAVQACRLLKNQEVLEEIKSCQKDIIKRSCLTEEKVLSTLMEVLDRCMSAIPVMKWDYEAHEYQETGVYEFDSKGALNAIKLLGQHLGMFERKIENEDKEFKLILPDDAKRWIV